MKNDLNTNFDQFSSIFTSVCIDCQVSIFRYFKNNSLYLCPL